MGGKRRRVQSSAAVEATSEETFEETTSESEAPAPIPAPEPAPLEQPSPPVVAYVVAPGKGVITASRGGLGEGQAVRPADFAGGEKRLAALARAGYLVPA
jgi:hypothetical protein